MTIRVQLQYDTNCACCNEPLVEGEYVLQEGFNVYCSAVCQRKGETK